MRRQGRRGVALVYPSPYHVGMASLGFQTVYRRLNELDDTTAERAFLPEPDDGGGPVLLTYESRRPVGDFGVIAFSVAYELEVTGVLACLAAAGLPMLAVERNEHSPLVVAGGPLTFSNPLPLAPFVDVIVMGEAEDLLAPLVEVAFAALSRGEKLRRLAERPGFYVPTLQGEVLLPVQRCGDAELPAFSAITTPESALPDMFLIEPERGCSRGCTFCVMRRSTNGGMRLVPPDRLLATIPTDARRVGLVGAAVTDHPRIVDIVRGIVDSGREIGLSSLRADRLTPEFVSLLARGGYRTLTVASDGASERLRMDLEKKIREKHLLGATELARDAGLAQVKVYMMVGVPGETDADLDELADFSLRQAQAAGPRMRLSLGVAPFVAKRNTPLDGAPFVGIREADRRIGRLRAALRGKVEVRPTSARWAWVEYVLAQGGWDAGLRAHAAWRAGGRFGDWRRAFAAVEPRGE